MAEERLQVGDRIPRFSAVDQRGFTLTEADLLGSPLVLYFYPKDDTPGCTKEACAFQQQLGVISSLDGFVVGVSPDGVDSHRKFIAKHKLAFPLLADEDKALCRLFGVLKEDQVERTTFVIDHTGLITWIERPVHVEGHLDRVMAALKMLALSDRNLSFEDKRRMRRARKLD